MYKTLKRNLAIVCIGLFLSTSLPSCYIHRHQVGEGPTEFNEVKKKNHFLIYGILPLHRANANKMAGDAENYEIVTKMNVLDVILTYITAGIYTPTTTKVIK